MHIWIDGLSGRHDRQMDEWADGQTNRLTHRPTDGWMDGICLHLRVLIEIKRKIEWYFICLRSKGTKWVNFPDILACVYLREADYFYLCPSFESTIPVKTVNFFFVIMVLNLNLKRELETCFHVCISKC